jgi:hypothetical protein
MPFLLVIDAPCENSLAETASAAVDAEGVKRLGVLASSTGALIVVLFKTTFCKFRDFETTGEHHCRMEWSGIGPLSNLGLVPGVGLFFERSVFPGVLATGVR